MRSALMLPIIIPIAFVLAAMVSEPALACAVCGAGEDESTGAFMISTAMLTFTPLMVLSAIGLFLFKRFHPKGLSLFSVMKSHLRAEAKAHSPVPARTKPAAGQPPR